jgi:hypothetical protein
MMRLLPLTVLFLACSTANLASGGVFGCKVDVPDCIGKYCCDDYCGKPLPSTRGVCCFGCNDYCGKPLPSARGVCCFGCNDSCKKCLPQVTCPQRKLTCNSGSCRDSQK